MLNWSWRWQQSAHPYNCVYNLRLNIYKFAFEKYFHIWNENVLQKNLYKNLRQAGSTSLWGRIVSRNMNKTSDISYWPIGPRLIFSKCIKVCGSWIMGWTVSILMQMCNSIIKIVASQLLNPINKPKYFAHFGGITYVHQYYGNRWVHRISKSTLGWDS